VADRPAEEPTIIVAKGKRIRCASRRKGIRLRRPHHRLERRRRDEKIGSKTGKVLIAVDPRYFRTTEVEALIATRARRTTARLRHRVTFDELVQTLVKSTSIDPVRATASWPHD